jgi:hypothetical protein
MDPISVLLYFICGGDIFDGLSWCKCGYLDGIAIYPDNFLILNKNWDEPENDCIIKMFGHNLDVLDRLKHQLIELTKKRDITVINFENGLMSKINQLIHQIPELDV